jgi:hypothetical protein
MAEVDYMHICDYAFPAEGGKPCIIGIFDRIFAPAFPATHVYMTVAVNVKGQPHEKIPAKLELGRPNGDVLATLNANAELTGEGAGLMQFALVNVQFPEQGRYTFKLSINGRTLATQSLRVQKAPAPAGGPQIPPQTTRH